MGGYPKDAEAKKCVKALTKEFGWTYDEAPAHAHPAGHLAMYGSFKRWLPHRCDVDSEDHGSGCVGGCQVVPPLLCSRSQQW